MPTHFADIYNNLYNSVDDQEDVQKLYKKMNDRINSLRLHDMLKDKPSIVLEVAGHLKSEKSDPSLKNAPMILFEQLATLLSIYLTYRHISNTNQG